MAPSLCEISLKLLDVINYPVSVHNGEVRESSVCGYNLIHKYDDNPIAYVNIHILFHLIV